MTKRDAPTKVRFTEPFFSPGYGEFKERQVAEVPHHFAEQLEAQGFAKIVVDKADDKEPEAKARKARTPKADADKVETSEEKTEAKAAKPDASLGPVVHDPINPHDQPLVIKGVDHTSEES